MSTDKFENIRPSFFAVKKPQALDTAGEVYSTVEDTTKWKTDVNGTPYQNGKLALSVSESTVIANANTLYPDLWANSPSDWKSGTTLTIPPMGSLVTNEWIDATAEMNQPSKKPLYTGVPDGNLNYIYYRYRIFGNTLEVDSRWDANAAGSGATGMEFPFPSGQEYGLSSLTPSLIGGVQPQKSVGVFTTFGILHAEPNSTKFNTAGGGIITGGNNLIMYRQGASSACTGQRITTDNTQVYFKGSLTIDESVDNYQTPIIVAVTNKAGGAMGVPDATEDTVGVTYETPRDNLFINGSLDNWQRGTSQNDSTYASCDRIRLSLHTAATTLSRQEFTVGQSVVEGNPKYYCRNVFTNSGSAGGYSTMVSRLEDVTAYSGKKVTLSFWAKANTALALSTEFTQFFGTGGSSSVNSIGMSKYTLGTSWQKFSVTATLPSIAGKTVGENNFFQVRFYFSAGSDWDARSSAIGFQDGTIDIAQIKLEEGPNATAFKRAGDGTYAAEQALCERYYEVIYATGSLVGSGQNVGNGNWFSRGTWRTKKRAIPNKVDVYYDTVQGTINEVRLYGGAHLAAAVEAYGIDSYSVKNNSGSDASFYGATYGITADAEL